MRYLLALAILVMFLPLAYAEVYIPDHEYAGYFDSEGIYTVIGAIKNTGETWITPSVTIYVEEVQQHQKEFTFVPIAPGSEQPFKVKFPELELQNPVLHEPELTYQTVSADVPLDVDVIYDDTLILHPDGHKTGRIINNGNEPVHYIKVYALIYSEEGKLLDMGQSLEIFDTINPGETREFTIYPDPSVASEAEYYSCFAVGDSSVIQINTQRKDDVYSFRYDSGAWFAYSTFSEDGKTLVMKTQNSFPLEMLTNFEFPRNSDTEKFDVLLNDKPIEYKQSLDEMGNWHVVFEMPAYTNGFVSVSGFEDPNQVSSFENVLKQNPEYEIVTPGPTTPDSNLYYLAILPAVAAIAGIVIYKKRN